MKINEIITEAWGMGYDSKTGQATGVLGRLASDFVGAHNYAATADMMKNRADKARMKKMAADASARTPDELANTVRADLPNTVDQMITPDAGASPENKFLKQWEIVDNDPPTVTHQNATYQRDEHGKWIDFKTGTAVPTRISQTLDRVSPPTGTTATNAVDQLPANALAKPTAPITRPAAPATTASTATPPVEQKARLTQNPDGSTIITDKHNVKWTKPAGKDYWVGPRDAIVMPGNEQYDKLENFSLNETLKESRSRK